MDARVFDALVQEIKDDVANASIAATSDREEARRLIVRACESAAELHADIGITGADLEDIERTVINDNLYYGALQPLLEDDSITEIMAVAGGYDPDSGYLPPRIYVERDGRVAACGEVTLSSEALKKIIDKITEEAGKRCDEAHPMGCAMLAGGLARATYKIPPVSPDGPSLVLRKFKEDMLGVDDLVAAGALTRSMAAFLRSAIASRCPVVISGGTGSGKTTLLNALSEYIPDGDVVVTIEDTPELRLRVPHVDRMQTVEPNTEGAGEITIRDLIKLALRSRPDRIIVGECRGADAYDMLQAMQTDHPGSMTTIHANDPDNAFTRLETMARYAGDFTHDQLQLQIAESLEGGLIVHTDRLDGGARKVVSIVEVSKMPKGATNIPRTPLFAWEQDGKDDLGNAVGRFTSCGSQPQLVKQKIEKAGMPYEPGWFFGIDGDGDGGCDAVEYEVDDYWATM